MTRKLSISIPQPCHENWQQMLPDEKGRFCLSCRESVIDFTDKSTEEIEQIIAGSNGRLCGRFRRSQLSVPEPVLKPRAAVWWKVAPLAVSAFCSGQWVAVSQVYAQTPTEQRETGAVQPREPEIHDGDSTITIKGTVLSEGSREAVWFAIVKVEGTGVECQTDTTGHFSLTIAASLLTTHDSLTVLAVGYEPIQMKITGEPMTIVLKENADLFVSGVVDTGYLYPAPKQTPQLKKVALKEVKKKKH